MPHHKAWPEAIPSLELFQKLSDALSVCQQTTTTVYHTMGAMEKMARVTTALGGNTITGRTMCCHLDAPSNAISVCRDAAQVVVAGRNIFKIYSIEEDQFVEKLNLRVGRKPSLNFSCADVVWHQMDENLLATAATNGVVVTWNLGKPSRNKQDQLFMEHKRTVNKVCFHPTEVYMLLSGSQDGYMKCFDLRKKDSVSTFSVSVTTSPLLPPLKMATFNCGIFAGLTATRGCSRPTMDLCSVAIGIQRTVWDMSTNRAKEIYCVQTIASVARVKWRPECKHHIATCSMMVDHNIYVWDIRRPFIPSAMFEEHKDVTTGIVWRHLHDPYFLLSGSKDSTLYQHIFKDASQPIERANPEGLCYSLFGDLAFAAKESLISSDSNRKPYLGDRRHPIFFKRKLDPAEQFEFISSSSALSVFEADAGCDTSSMDWFVRTARQYLLTGRPLAELPNTVPATNLNHSLGKSSSSLPLMNSFNLKDIPSGIGTESRLERTKAENRPEAILMDSSSTLINNDAEEQEYILPQEAFPLRHEIVDNPSALDHLQDKADSPHVSGNEAETVSLTPVESFSLISISHSLYENRLPADFFSPIVHDMLLFYAEQGDVQMAVSVLIVLGDRIKKGIDDQTQEHWYMSYIDLLQRFQLWNISNEVIKLSTCRAIHCLNQASTTLHINCSSCKRPMSNKGWICDRCRQCASMCAVCHHVVKGLFVWCQGCSHGGHLQHIMKWLETSSHCPTGCGHLCEYT
ncbi:hypothetical protein E2320_012023 [Naja naja]|nr:hypothetical protein E2320_012023 [Naja naja]